MGPIGPQQVELFAFEMRKIAAFDLVYSLASTNEFDYRSGCTRSVSVICLEIEKLNLISF